MQISPNFTASSLTRPTTSAPASPVQSESASEAEISPAVQQESVTISEGGSDDGPGVFQRIARGVVGATAAVVGATAGAAVGGISTSDSGKVELPGLAHRLARKGGALTGLAAGLAIGLSGGVVALAAGAVLGPIVGAVFGGGVASGVEAGIDATVGAAKGAKGGAVNGWQAGTGMVDRLFDRFAREPKEEPQGEPKDGASVGGPALQPQEPILLN